MSIFRALLVSAFDTIIDSLNSLFTQTEQFRDDTEDFKNDANESSITSSHWAEGTDAQVQVLGGEKSSLGWAGVSEEKANEAIDAVDQITGSIYLVDEGDDFFELVAFSPAQLIEETITVEGFQFETILIQTS